MSKIIEFVKKNDSAVNPASGHKVIPDWFKKLPARVKDIKTISNSTAKMCMPFNDALQTGWVLNSPCDIDLSTADINTECVEKVNKTAVTNLEGNSTFKLPDLVVDTGWEINTPEGYSVLVLHKMNRDEERFRIISQFIPTDIIDSTVKIPVISQSSEMINRGDGLAQIIPIKRSDAFTDFTLKPDINDEIIDVSKRHLKNVKVNSGYYRKQCWVKKPKSITYQNENEINRDKPELTTDNEEFIDGVMFSLSDSIEGFYPEPLDSETYIKDTNFDKLQMQYDWVKWAKLAMTIGMIPRSPVKYNISMDENGNADITSSGNSTHEHQQSYRKIGGDHPLMPINLVNLHNDWVLAAENGLSILVTRPLNHIQKKYVSYSGMIDSDMYYTGANVPGRYRMDKEMPLEREMPVGQLIPIRRDNMIFNGVIKNE